jgi:hypothetical protein
VYCFNIYIISHIAESKPKIRKLGDKKNQK